jgi:putative metallohydrolase (TIGR04338 family)
MSGRDFQRSKVYAAEIEMINLVDTAQKMGITTLRIGASDIAVPIERKFGDMDGVQRYVDLVLGEVAREYGVSADVRVRERKGNTKAHYESPGGVIAVPPHQGSRSSWAMREFVVLHEIAHHLTNGHQHDGVFVAALADLFGRFVGPEAQFMFTVITHQGNVTHS